MHGVMLGVTKLMLKLWFSNEHKKESFSVHDRLNLFDSRLVDIKPTVEITRPPRSYQKFGHDWKASAQKRFNFLWCSSLDRYITQGTTCTFVIIIS